MTPLFTPKDFAAAKSLDKLPCKCKNCSNTFGIRKNYIQVFNKGKKKITLDFCSKKCMGINRITKVEVSCTSCNRQFLKRLSRAKSAKSHFCSNVCKSRSGSGTSEIKVSCEICNKQFLRRPSQLKNYPNHFCSRSCAATYQHAYKTHKPKGTRRSKLEVYLEEQIRLQYPQYELICNGKSTINSELDFYFPSLKLAIELNGIFHYEPIFGPDKLAKIQNNDQRKFAACIEACIALAIIDSGSSKYITKKSKDYFWTIAQSIINQHIISHTL
jgi:hypothetical protein